MKIKHLISLIGLLFVFSNLSAQTAPRLLNLEMSAGLAFNHRNILVTAGLHSAIGSHIKAGLFMATDPMGFQEIKSISTEANLNFSNATINHRPVYGFEVKYYQHKNQGGFFLGSGIYKGAYKIDAFTYTEKINPVTSSIGGNVFDPTPDTYKEYHQTTTRGNHLGITSELGYTLPVKNGRFEASFRIFNPLYKDKKFEIWKEDAANLNQKISIKENFRTVSGNLQLRYVRVF